MITKSMSSKTKSWSKLYDYITRDNSNQLFSWGMSSNPYNREEVLNDYESNYKYIENNKKAKNTYYHEVLSLPENTLSSDDQESALFDLADKYISMRANGNLVLGSIHSDTNHMHMHLMISSNKYMDQKMTRYSKKNFKLIQSRVEKYKNIKYPTLKTEHYQKNHRAKQKQKRVEQEINHKRKKQTKKQKVLNDFKSTLNTAMTKRELIYNLKQKDYTLYKRGKYYGIRDIREKKNYRLKTLEENLDTKLVNKLKQMEKHQQTIQQNLQKGQKHERAI